MANKLRKEYGKDHQPRSHVPGRVYGGFRRADQLDKDGRGDRGLRRGILEDSDGDNIRPKNLSTHGPVLAGRIERPRQMARLDCGLCQMGGSGVESGRNHDPDVDRLEEHADHVVEQVAAIKKEIKGDLLLLGSGQLTGTLLGAGLVDEVVVTITPVLLGKGLPYFSG